MQLETKSTATSATSASQLFAIYTSNAANCMAVLWSGLGHMVAWHLPGEPVVEAVQTAV